MQETSAKVVTTPPQKVGPTWICNSNYIIGWMPFFVVAVEVCIFLGFTKIKDKNKGEQVKHLHGDACSTQSEWYGLEWTLKLI